MDGEREEQEQDYEERQKPIFEKLKYDKFFSSSRSFLNIVLLGSLKIIISKLGLSCATLRFSLAT